MMKRISYRLLPGGETVTKLIVIKAHKAQLITGLLPTTFQPPRKHIAPCAQRVPFDQDHPPGRRFLTHPRNCWT